MASDAASADPAEWSVLVYLAASDDLAPAAEACLAAILAAPRTPAVNLAVQIRRPGAGGADPTAARYHVRGPVSEAGPPTTASMASPGALTEFIEWGLSTAPARRSLLVVSGHGGGVEDPDHGARRLAIIDGGAISDQQFRDAIAGSAARRVDVLGCDACLMSMVEIAYEMRGVAGFMVSSETDTPQQGWPYGSILAALVEAPSMDAAALGRMIVDRFDAWYRDPTSHSDLSYATLAAVDLGATPDLATSIDALAGVLIAKIPAELSALAQVAAFVSPMEVPDYVDLVDFLDEVDRALPAADVAAATQRVRAALSAARIAGSAVGDGAAGTSGLSIYFPTQENAGAFQGYADLSFAEATRWPAFLRAYLAAPAEGDGPDVLREPVTLADGLSSRGFGVCDPIAERRGED